MNDDILRELYRGLPKRERVKYTRKAFKMIPYINKPQILDIGCGTGVPTLEIAKLSGGKIVAIDIKQESLNELERKARLYNLSDRITTIKSSMVNMSFPDGYFDIIWTEGSIFFIGFEKGLREWRKFIKSEGFLVVHEMCYLEPDPPPELSNYWKKVYPKIRTFEGNLEFIPKCGYELAKYFTLPEDAWARLYYKPLGERVGFLREKYRDNAEVMIILDKEQKEIEIYNKYYKWYGSAFYVMQKSE